jgi:hypothetical protein
MPKLLVFLAWLNPHHETSIHELFFSKTSFFSCSWLLVFSFIPFSKGIQWNVPWKGSVDRVTLVSHFLWNHKKNCNNDAFNKNSRLWTKTSKEILKLPIRNPSISSQTFFVIVERQSRITKCKRDGKERKTNLFVVAIVNEKYVQLSVKIMKFDISVCGTIFCTISIVRLTFSLRTPFEDIWKAFLRLFR